MSRAGTTRCAGRDAVAAASSLLGKATYPLIYGLSRGSNQTCSAAVALAERLHAVLDVSLSPFQRAFTLSRQHVGDRTATLGFVRNHATQVVFLGCDPLSSHPRHLERYSGGTGKVLVTVGASPDAATAPISRHFQISPGSAYHAVLALRSITKAAPVDTRQIESVTGLSMDVWRELHDMIVQAPLTALFLGKADCGHSLGELILFWEAALQWGADINRNTRMVTLALENGFNTAGAIDTLTWQTGFPFALDYSAGFPQFDPDRFSVERLLADEVVDAAVVVDASEDGMTSPLLTDAWGRLPCVVIGSAPLRLIPDPHVWIPTATTGIDAVGTVHRSDHVAWRARKLIHSTRPTSATVLGQVMEAGVGAKRAAKPP